MSFRFRRSARLGPLRFNYRFAGLRLRQGGLSSISVGGRGASFNVPVSRSGGPRTTVGLPGTGLSWSVEHNLDRPAAIPAGPAAGLPNSRRLRPGRSTTFMGRCSCHLRRPALLADHVVSPALAAAGEVLAVGDQALVEVTGEHRDAVHARVVSEPVTGHADLAAAGLEQGALIEVGPVFDQGFESGGHGRWPGERDTHGQTVLDAY